MRRGIPIPADVVRGVLYDRRRRYTYDELAEKYQISTSSVNNILRKNGKSRNKARTHAEAIVMYKQVAADYVKGRDRSEICEMYKIRPQTIYTALKWCEARLGYRIPRRRERDA